MTGTDGEMDGDGPTISVPPTVEQLAAALRQDPVLLDQRFGNGDTAAVRDGFDDLLARAEHPTYVVMTDPPDGLAARDPAADLATRLHGELGGGDATFVVRVDSSNASDTVGSALVGFGDAPGEDALSEGSPSARYEGGSEAGVSDAGVLARDLDVVLGDEPFDDDDWEAYAASEPWAVIETWEPGADHPDGADAVFAPSFLVVAVAGVVWVLLGEALRWRAVPAAPGRGDRRATAPTGTTETTTRLRTPGTDDLAGADPASVRRRLDTELDDVADAVAARGEHVPAERRERLDGSLETARALTERLGPDDLADTVGALVLVRIAARELDAADPGRRRRAAPRPPYRCCAIDPRHGEAAAARDLPVADRTLAVPVCGRCRDADAPSLMRVPGGRWPRRARVYLDTDTVWARTGYGAFVDELWTHVATDLRGRR